MRSRTWLKLGEAGDFVAALHLHPGREIAFPARDAVLQALEPPRQPPHDRIGAYRDGDEDQGEDEHAEAPAAVRGAREPASSSSRAADRRAARRAGVPRCGASIGWLTSACACRRGAKSEVDVQVVRQVRAAAAAGGRGAGGRRMLRDRASASSPTTAGEARSRQGRDERTRRARDPRGNAEVEPAHSGAGSSRRFKDAAPAAHGDGRRGSSDRPDRARMRTRARRSAIEGPERLASYQVMRVARQYAPAFRQAPRRARIAARQRPSAPSRRTARACDRFEARAASPRGRGAACECPQPGGALRGRTAG